MLIPHCLSSAFAELCCFCPGRVVAGCKYDLAEVKIGPKVRRRHSVAGLRRWIVQCEQLLEALRKYGVNESIRQLMDPLRP